MIEEEKIVLNPQDKENFNLESTKIRDFKPWIHKGLLNL